MDITLQPLEPGHYVVAVSGGVDSMALLHLLRQVPGVKLTVAHFDHGIRRDSAEDRRLVADLARKLGLPFVFAEGRLGEQASEATARQARYKFLHKVRQAAGARAVVTGHHQDDAIETAVINLIRGTGRKGLTSMGSTDYVKRPLLHVSKADIRRFAAMEGLVWREDSTNIDPAYLRNHIRHNIIAKLSPKDRARFHDLVAAMRRTNQELDTMLRAHLQEHHTGNYLNRHQFIMLPHDVAREVMAAWLRVNGLRTFDAKTLERLVRAAKVMKSGKQVDVNRALTMKITKDNLALIPNER